MNRQSITRILFALSLLTIMLAAGCKPPEPNTNLYQKFLATHAQAVAGEADAQCELGMIYFEGRGIVKDEIQGVNWWRKAAEQNHAVSQLFLGLMYSKGRGVPKDKIEAHVWLNLAGANGLKEARELLGEIESEMTENEKNASTKRASLLFQKLARQ